MRFNAAIADRIGVGMVILGMMTMPLVASTHLPTIWHSVALVAALIVTMSGGCLRSRVRRHREAADQQRL
jgi:hypothetical protein